MELQIIVADMGRRVVLQADELDLPMLAATACGQFE